MGCNIEHLRGKIRGLRPAAEGTVYTARGCDVQVVLGAVVVGSWQLLCHLCTGASRQALQI